MLNARQPTMSNCTKFIKASEKLFAVKIETVHSPRNSRYDLMIKLSLSLRNNEFVSNSFRVTGGNLKGDWVAVWGNYTFTQNGVTVILPYQFTAMIENGKIEKSTIYYDKLAINRAMGYELTAKKN